MKTTTILVLCLAAFFACNSGKTNIPEAISTARKAVQLTLKGNFSELQPMYSEEFSESEPADVRISKFTRIFAATGAVSSAELIDSAGIAADEEGWVAVKFSLKAARTPLIETIVLQLQGGAYKICRMDISQSK